MKNKKILTLIIILFSFLKNEINAQEKTKPAVAVVDFTNNTGIAGLEFLSKSIAENVSSRFSESKKYRVIERIQITKILKEMELQQMGLVTPSQTQKAGELLQADYLIVGSYSGKSTALNVQIRAINASTGEIKTAKTVSGDMDNIIPLIDSTTGQIIELLIGMPTGMLTLQSTPTGAHVFIDGHLVADTPLTGYYLSAGHHKLLVQKEGYIDYRQVINITKDKEESQNIILDQNTVRNVNGVYIGAYYTDFSLINITFPGISPAVSFQMGYYHTFSHIRIGLDLAYINLPRHDYYYKVPYQTLKDPRYYFIGSAGASFIYIPFLTLQIISPYVGLHATLLRIEDRRELNDTSSKLVQLQGAFATGPVIGLSILPYSTFRIFAESRFMMTVHRLNRNVIKSVAITGQTFDEDQSKYFGYLTIGGGVSVQF